MFYCTFLGAFLVLFQIGIYFVYIPWNAERLQITEAEIGMGLFAFGLLNLIGNQTSGRLVVPRIGTKNSIVIGLLGIAYCPLLLILSPNYYQYEQKKLVSKLKKIGFKNIYRIKKKVAFNNIRTLVAPFYHHYDHDLSRFLYGDGDIGLVLKKK